MKKKVLGKKEPITCRPADLLKPGLDQARKDAGSLAKSEEDVLTYALFPEIAKDYFPVSDARAGKGSRRSRQSAQRGSGDCSRLPALPFK